MREKYYFFIKFLLGIVLIVTGIGCLVYQVSLFYLLVVLLGLVVLEKGITSLIHFIKHKENQSLMSFFINITGGVLLVLYPSIPVSLLVILFALYVLISGCSYFLTYCLYHLDQVKGRLAFLLAAIMFIWMGLSFLVSPYIHQKQMIIILSIYLIILGIRDLISAINEILSYNHVESLKRRIHFGPPVFVVALIPRFVLQYINSRLQAQEHNYKTMQEDLIEVIVHVSEKGFGTIGHVDLCYHGTIISYGAYDEDSHHLFGAIADGVLFECDRDDYFEFCIEEDQKATLFLYGLSLNNAQKESMLRRIKDLKKETYTFIPACVSDASKKDYASRLYQKAGANFYKFKKGRYRKYFVMVTNCVLLADDILGSSGSDIVNMNGIITPGAYYSYLEEESHREYSRVIYKKIINQTTL